MGRASPLGRSRFTAESGQDDGAVSGERCVVALVQPEQVGDDQERQAICDGGPGIHGAAARPGAKQLGDASGDQRPDALDAPTDELGRHDRPALAVGGPIEVHEGRTDLFREPAIRPLHPVGRGVAKHGQDVVIAGDDPAVVDRVVPDRRLVTESTPGLGRVVAVGLRVEEVRRDHGFTPPV